MTVFSMTDPVCTSCKYYLDCQNKRLVHCAFLDSAISANVGEQSKESIVQPMLIKHDYRDIKIGENTTVTIDLEELKKQMVDEFYKSFGLEFSLCDRA